MPDALVLDVSGLDSLFGPPQRLAERIAWETRRAGLETSVAVAANPDAALYAARGFAGVTVIPPGEEARALAALPLALLQPTEEVAETLRLWGLKTFGDLAALPETGVSERLGDEGVRLRRVALGASDRALVPFVPELVFEQSIELEYAVTLLEPLAFILAGLLNQLCAALDGRALATNELRLRLKLDPPEGAQGAANEMQFERVLRLPFPMCNSRLFLKLLRLDLEKAPPHAPVVGVSLRAAPVRPRTIQNGLFLPAAPEPEKLELTLKRIASLVGEGNVGSAEVLETHRPDGFRISDFGLRIGGTRNAECGMRNAGPRLGFRYFRPALSAQVDSANGRPTHVAARGVHGKIAKLAGPWRTAGDWWAPTAWARDEWDVLLTSGALYRIYRDLTSSEWFVDGSYD